MPLTPAENYRRTVLFENPEWIPMIFHINNACWDHYDPNALRDLMTERSLLFPGFHPKDHVVPHYEVTQRKDEPYTDPRGCVWTTMIDGITGSVTGHPLADWKRFEDYQQCGRVWVFLERLRGVDGVVGNREAEAGTRPAFRVGSGRLVARAGCERPAHGDERGCSAAC